MASAKWETAHLKTDVGSMGRVTLNDQRPVKSTQGDEHLPRAVDADRDLQLDVG